MNVGDRWTEWLVNLRHPMQDPDQFETLRAVFLHPMPTLRNVLATPVANSHLMQAPSRARYQARISDGADALGSAFRAGFR
jgi:hypothetical protein